MIGRLHSVQRESRGKVGARIFGGQKIQISADSGRADERGKGGKAFALPLQLSRAIRLVLAENRRVLKSISYPSLSGAASAITSARRVFVVGEGRSGLAIRMVAMRLMHLGCQVHVIGETTTPAMSTGDALIAFSGSGNTGLVSMTAEKARAVGGYVLAVTTQADSPVATAANLVINIAAAAKQDRSNKRSKQFAGSLFEQSALLLFDALFHVLSIALNKDPESLWSMHTNLA